MSVGSRSAPIWAAIVLAMVAGSQADEGDTFFEKQVRPILVARCYDCHAEQAGKRKGGLWLDRKAGWQRGGDSGPAIVPGDPDSSLLLRAVRYLDEDLQMPPERRLPARELAVLEKWIAIGTPDPRDAPMASAARNPPIDFAAARETWAFRPHSNPDIPSVRDTRWPRGDIDAFILAAIEQRGLEPAADAGPASLLRRLHFDLTGLPPTPDEVAAFIADPSPQALERRVDDLLARPAFGEKWGRHWLDVARYADSNGGDRNFTYFQAWRFRNYVIDSFNSDRPFYQFVRQQLAGDLMDAADDTQRREQLVAATFLALGPKMLTERDKEKLNLDTADEQIDTLGRAFLGLTFGCARCHDHKFDPISQEDYYALAGIFRSTQVVMGTQNGCVNVASWVEQALPVAEPKRSELEAKLGRVELAMRLAVEKSFMAKAGGKMALDKLPLAGVIYDDADAELVGEWKPSTRSMNRFGAQYVHDDRQGKGEKQVIFRASLPESGIYEVRLAYNGGATRARAVPVTVEAWDGVHECRLDQTQEPALGGLFQAVGRFRFEKGGRANVIISTGGTEGFVIVDAVQFVAEADIEREAMAIATAAGEQGDPLLRMSEAEVKKELGKLLTELRSEDLAMAPRDARDAGDIHLRVRGEPGQLGPLVARGFPEVLHAGPAPVIPDGQSGRLQFAEWLTGPDMALLDRVLVNRVWSHLFGRGIVATVDHFGAIGAPPTHPELLEFLASDFRAGGGSIKSLIRKIVLSRSYQLGAAPSEALAAADLQNDLFARQNRRRLTAEEIRDAALFIAGGLAPGRGEATAAKFGEDLDKPMDFAKERLRTVYLPVARNNLVAELAVFDAANPDLVIGKRPVTTVPTQALFLLNGGFFKDQARALARDALGSGSSPREEVAWLYLKVLNRPPAEAESGRALAFVSDLSGAADSGDALEDAYAHLAHVLLISTEFLFLE